MARRVAKPKAPKVSKPRVAKAKPAPKAKRVPGTAGAVASPYHLASAGEGAANLELTGSPVRASRVLLQMVGERSISVSHALAAWTREQDRLANNAWRRPGGLARMGVL